MWPFKPRVAGTEEPSSTRGPSETPSREWARVSPVTTTVESFPVTIETTSFQADLAAQRPPEKFLKPLSHGLSRSGPSGLIGGLVLPARPPAGRTQAPAQRSAVSFAKRPTTRWPLFDSPDAFPAEPPDGPAEPPDGPTFAGAGPAVAYPEPLGPAASRSPEPAPTRPLPVAVPGAEPGRALVHASSEELPVVRFPALTAVPATPAVVASSPVDQAPDPAGDSAAFELNNVGPMAEGTRSLLGSDKQNPPASDAGLPANGQPVPIQREPAPQADQPATGNRLPNSSSQPPTRWEPGPDTVGTGGPPSIQREAAVGPSGPGEAGTHPATRGETGYRQLTRREAGERPMAPGQPGIQPWSSSEPGDRPSDLPAPASGPTAGHLPVRRAAATTPVDPRPLPLRPPKSNPGRPLGLGPPLASAVQRELNDGSPAPMPVPSMPVPAMPAPDPELERPALLPDEPVDQPPTTQAGRSTTEATPSDIRSATEPVRREPHPVQPDAPTLGGEPAHDLTALGAPGLGVPQLPVLADHPVEPVSGTPGTGTGATEFAPVQRFTSEHGPGEPSDRESSGFAPRSPVGAPQAPDRAASAGRTGDAVRDEPPSLEVPQPEPAASEREPAAEPALPTLGLQKREESLSPSEHAEPGPASDAANTSSSAGRPLQPPFSEPESTTTPTLAHPAGGLTLNLPHAESAGAAPLLSTQNKSVQRLAQPGIPEFDESVQTFVEPPPASRSQAYNEPHVPLLGLDVESTSTALPGEQPFGPEPVPVPPTTSKGGDEAPAAGRPLLGETNSGASLHSPVVPAAPAAVAGDGETGFAPPQARVPIQPSSFIERARTWAAERVQRLPSNPAAQPSGRASFDRVEMNRSAGDGPVGNINLPLPNTAVRPASSAPAVHPVRPTLQRSSDPQQHGAEGSEPVLGNLDPAAALQRFPATPPAGPRTRHGDSLPALDRPALTGEASGQPLLGALDRQPFITSTFSESSGPEPASAGDHAPRSLPSSPHRTTGLPAPESDDASVPGRPERKAGEPANPLLQPANLLLQRSTLSSTDHFFARSQWDGDTAPTSRPHLQAFEAPAGTQPIPASFRSDPATTPASLPVSASYRPDPGTTFVTQPARALRREESASSSTASHPLLAKQQPGRDATTSAAPQDFVAPYRPDSGSASNMTPAHKRPDTPGVTGLRSSAPVQRQSAGQPPRSAFTAPAQEAAEAAIAAGIASRSEDGALIFRSPDPPAPQAPASTPAPAAPPVTVQRTNVGIPPPQADEPADLDELAMRLYPKLRPYLRKDLWLDRERSGLLADLR